jgi:hypothetical protein
VDNYVEGLTQNQLFDKTTLLLPIVLIGSTPANRKRILQFIADKSVAPNKMANIFRSGRWLDGVPIHEVVTIMEFLAQGENWAPALADILMLYAHLNKRIRVTNPA